MNEETYRLFSFILAATSFISAVIFFVAVVYRDSLAKKYLGPQIVLSEKDFPQGEDTSLGEKNTLARYWHLEVVNERPYVQAEAVELCLLALSIGERETEIEQKMPGYLPIKTRGELGPATLGYKEITFDFCRFIDNKGLFIMIEGNKIPNNFKNGITSPGSFTAILQAKGHNAASQKLIVKAAWDGVKNFTALKPTSIKIVAHEVR